MISLSKFIGLIISGVVSLSQVYSQTPDTSETRALEAAARRIVSEGLRTCPAYGMLRELTSRAPRRLCGSPQAREAVQWGKNTMQELGFQNVHIEPVIVPHWVRGPVEEAYIITQSGGKIPVRVCALGGSIATPEEGLTAGVLEVKSFEELAAAGERARGKIIFFNRPMDRTKINPFEAYGGAVNQRSQGAVEAAKAGGVAALVRSMTMRIDDSPHTGAMGYRDSIQKVPSAAISTRGAELLDSLLAINKDLKLRLKLSCQTLGDVESANVVGELTGTEKPDEVIVVGGHLDCWDLGEGAVDDGAGCVQSMETLRLMKELGLKPKRTVRAVLFMNEEFGLNGGRAYAEKERPGEKPIAAIESDAGGFTPRGFGISADSLVFQKLARWSYLLEPIDAAQIRRGGGGADISELAKKGGVSIGLRVDAQRYFDYHHSENDSFDTVNDRELELGAAALAILTFVIAQEGI